MPWGIAAAGVASAVAGGVASTSAAGTQADAAKAASAEQLAMFQNTTDSLRPYMAAGGEGLNALIQGLGLGPIGGAGAPGADAIAAGSLTKPFTAADFQSSPGYQFQLGQGIQAIDSSASAKGVTGNTLKDLMTFGEGLANTDWWNAYNAFTGRQKTLYDMFSGVAGSGQNAAVHLGGFGAQTAGQIGSNIIGAGNAQAAGTVGAANAFSGGINNAAQNYMLYQLMQQNQNQPSPSTAGYY